MAPRVPRVSWARGPFCCLSPHSHLEPQFYSQTPQLHQHPPEQLWPFLPSEGQLHLLAFWAVISIRVPNEGITAQLYTISSWHTSCPAPGQSSPLRFVHLGRAKLDTAFETPSYYLKCTVINLIGDLFVDVAHTSKGTERDTVKSMSPFVFCPSCLISFSFLFFWGNHYCYF